MPRTHHAGVSTLRNRNRITNKTRLKIHHGNIEADVLLIPDEDEERHRLTNLVAGVDAEDANELHLQEVLNASHRTPVVASHASSSDELAAPHVLVTFIPTPDSGGVVDNHEELYPPNRWRDPTTFVYSSSTVEETTTDGLNDDFTYYMDERDKEWLDKNNEEARGEGTSAQGSVSPSSARGSRSAKGKGKEPESSQPVVISENEFELVMGVFEKVTHEKTEFLHHSLETGMPFPAFLDYQETFSSPLPANMFTTFVVPSWVPPPNSLIKIAHAVYPYWKERRLQRNGHRIIPILNFDEADTLNESYVCFRRREAKAVRKTRAQQTSSSEKLARLQAELSYPFELAKSLLAREMLKLEASQNAQAIWENRMAIVDLKRKFPGLGDKHDDEMLVDKERVMKKQEPRARIPLKIRTTQDAGATPSRPEAPMRPRELLASIHDQIELTLANQRDPLWEDLVDGPYQVPVVPLSARLFKFIPPPEAPLWPADDDEPVNRNPRSVRSRIGRCGRLFIDRRDFVPPPMSNKRRRHSALVDSDDEDAMNVDEDEEEEEAARLQERWRFDMDDGPIIGPQGADEHDRALVDDYASKYLRYAMTLLGEKDHQELITYSGPRKDKETDSKPNMSSPVRHGMAIPQALLRKDAKSFPIGSLTAHPIHNLPQFKNMPPLNSGAQMRISSNGGMRPPNAPLTAQSASATLISPPVPLPVPQHSPPNPSTRAAITMPHVDVSKPDNNQPSAIQNGILNHQHLQALQAAHKAPNQPQMQQVPNGFHLMPHGTPGLTVPNYQQFQNAHAQQLHALSSQLQLSPQQLHSQALLLQAQQAQQMAQYMMGPGGVPVAMPMSNAAGVNQRLPVGRSTQWPAAVQRPAGMADVSVPNGMLSTTIRFPLPPDNGQMAISPRQQGKSVSPKITSAGLPKTPKLGMTSPSFSRQQPVT